MARGCASLRIFVIEGAMRAAYIVENFEGVAMMIRRTDEFGQRLEDAGAQRSAAGVVESYGDALAEARAIRGGALGLVDRSERETLVITGKDTITWFQSLFTNDVMQLVEEGSGQRTHGVGRVGRVITDARVLHVPELLVVDLEPGTLAGGLRKHLDAHIIMEDVEATDRTEQTGKLELIGRGAAAALAELAELDRSPAALKDHHGTWGELGGEEILVQRLAMRGGIERFLISCDREAVVRVWDAIRRGALVAPTGEQAVEILRTESGDARFMVDYDQDAIPIEADLNDTINYDKGCYLGQEIIHRLDTQGTPAKFLRLVVPDDAATTLEVGQPVVLDGKEVGQLVRVTPTTRGAQVGVAFLKRGAYAPDTAVAVRGAAGEVSCKVVPFGGLEA
jgi:folate-binding protein YgfZ